jgi:hypothetical protein
LVEKMVVMSVVWWADCLVVWKAVWMAALMAAL